MDAMTAAEILISAHAGRLVRAGEIVMVNITGSMAVDAGAPFIIQSFKQMGGSRLWDASRVSLVIDHAAPAPNARIGHLHQIMRQFAAEMDCQLFESGEGICHQLMVENRRVKPGDLFIGGDSHTCTYGALGAFAVGMGSTDLAAIWLTGQTWLRVPETIQVILEGSLRPYVSAKDLSLLVASRLGPDGAAYQSIEYKGSAVHTMSLASRMTLANMAAETGAKSVFIDMQGLELSYPFEPIQPGFGANYSQSIHLDCSSLYPLVSLPGSPNQVVSIHEIAGKRVDLAFIGTCTNGRLEDLRVAAELLKGRRVSPHVRLLVTPASKAVFNSALQDGTVQALSEAGATFLPSSCGPCAGTHLGIPGDDETVISSGSRNFPGRMGNPHANVYLSSPAVVAASALAGVLIDPAEVV